MTITKWQAVALVSFSVSSYYAAAILIFNYYPTVSPADVILGAALTALIADF